MSGLVAAVRAMIIVIALAAALFLQAQSGAIPPRPAVPASPSGTSANKTGTYIRDMLDRLAAEASAYAKLAVQVTGEEVIRQHAVRARSKFTQRVTDDNKARDREIVSLYGVSLIGGSLHEIRQVIEVDGMRVQDEQRAQKTLTALLNDRADQQKLAALKQLEKYTLSGAATDFGPLILLFSRAWEKLEEARPGGIRLVPQAQIQQALAADYAAMSGMMFGTAPGFDWVLDELRALEARIDCATAQ